MPGVGAGFGTGVKASRNCLRPKLPLAFCINGMDGMDLWTSEQLFKLSYICPKNVSHGDLRMLASLMPTGGPAVPISCPQMCLGMHAQWCHGLGFINCGPCSCNVQLQVETGASTNKGCVIATSLARELPAQRQNENRTRTRAENRARPRAGRRRCAFLVAKIADHLDLIPRYGG